MKKLYGITGLALITALTLTGCGNNETNKPPKPTETTQTETTNDNTHNEWKPCGADTTGDIEVGQGLCDHHGN
jgi:lipoprotein